MHGHDTCLVHSPDRKERGRVNGAKKGRHKQRVTMPTAEQIASVTEQARARNALAAAELGIVDMDDLANYVKAELAACAHEGARVGWTRILLEILKATEGQNVVYHFVYGDPDLPVGPGAEMPPIPLPDGSTAQKN